MPVAISTARLEARISTDLHSMLKRAAELQGRTMTDFVVSAVQDAAQRHRASRSHPPVFGRSGMFRASAAVAAATGPSSGTCLCPSPQTLAR